MYQQHSIKIDRPASRKGAKMGRFNRNTRNGGGAKKGTVKKKKTLEDYFFYVGSSKQASDYEVTANFVIKRSIMERTSGMH